MKTSNAIQGSRHCGCPCFIIPAKVLRKFSRDKNLSADERKSFADAAKFESEWRKERQVRLTFSLAAQRILPSSLTLVPFAPPVVKVFDCQNRNTIPGVAVINPGGSADPTCKRVFIETSAVADFYQAVFGRNSIDGDGMSMISSIHYSLNYRNAFWNGSQMTYGDGDGDIFIDFTKGNDVIAHELTHGITQYTLGLNYNNEAGGLNESVSDVFGSMFRQWRAGEDVSQADWLIGKDIMGPGAISRGYKCLRDMSNPGASHCLAPQPENFSQYCNGMDPHESSGIPNFAFYKAAMAIGGNSWEVTGRIWYRAITDFGPAPNMRMKQFADRTRELAGTLYSTQQEIKQAVDAAWQAVGL